MATSYTQATGKRPFFDKKQTDYAWYDDMAGDSDELPCVVFGRLEGGRMEGPTGLYRAYPTEAEAMQDADAAYLRALEDGAIEPIGTEVQS